MKIDFPLHYIDSYEELEKLKEHLLSLKEFALDLEADVNLHRYGRKLCLAQIWDGKDCWLIDLRELNISVLKGIIENPEILKIMYAASFDVSLLADLLEMELQGLFDIQVCSSILGNGKRSLKHFIHETFSIDLEKDMQTSDWYRRPLSEEQLVYAAYDVRYLIEAKELILGQLETEDLLESAYDAFHKVERSRFHELKDPYLKVRNSAKLTPYEKIRLKEFYEVREKIAEEWDLPSYKVLRSYQLIKLSQNPPDRVEELEGMEVFNEKLQNYKEEFLTAARKAEKQVLEENSKIREELIEFRHLLHKHPELTGKENGTEKRIFRFIRNFSPSKIYRNLGRNSSIYTFSSGTEGPTVIFRVNINGEVGYEKAEHDWFSRSKKIVHSIGNDGHTVVLLALAARLFEKSLKKGNIGLLFQASAANGKGAKKVVRDKRFSEVNADYMFSFHNLPGYERGSIITSASSFSYAKSSFIISLFEIKEFIHEEGYKDVLADVCLELCRYIREEIALSRINHIQLGKPSIIIHPMKAELRIDIQHPEDNELLHIQETLREYIEKTCIENHLRFEMHKTTELPASRTHSEALELLQNALPEDEFITEDKALIEDDDFGYYFGGARIIQFGIGIGKEANALGRCDYDFPDTMIEPIVDKLINILMYMGIL